MECARERGVQSRREDARQDCKSLAMLILLAAGLLNDHIHAVLNAIFQPQAGQGLRGRLEHACDIFGEGIMV